MMKTLDMLSKNHPDKHKSRLHKTPKEPQYTQEFVRCSPGGS